MILQNTPAVNLVEITGLTRRFGTKLALDNVSLSMPSGSVFGLIGENGAGKTTLIKHILGLLNTQSGTVRVFGQNPVLSPVEVLSDIGYLSEENDLPKWMTLTELIQYVQPFYKNWDALYAEELRQTFGLGLHDRLSNLSKGQRARAGLLTALAYRPKLLLFDEPSSGLDPIVRRDILNSIVREIASEGRTVLFSSHLLSEVDQVCDYVAMLRKGKVVFCESLQLLKGRFILAEVQFDVLRDTVPSPAEGVLVWQRLDKHWTAVSDIDPSSLASSIAKVGGQIVQCSSASLEDIFLALSAKTQGENL